MAHESGALLTLQVPTVVIGCLPTYSIGNYTAGIAAPILLTIMRLLQVREGRNLCMRVSRTVLLLAQCLALSTCTALSPSPFCVHPLLAALPCVLCRAWPWVASLAR